VQVIFAVISIIILAVYIVAPIFLTIYFRRNVKRFHLSTFKLRYKEVINDLSYRNNSSPYYFLLFCYRRLAANLIIVLLPSYSSSQIMLNVFLSQMVVFSLGFVNIYQEAYNNRLNYFNEAMVLLTGYHLFCFTDFVPKAATRYQVGQSLVCVIILTICVNLSGVARLVILSVRRLIRMHIKRREYRKRCAHLKRVEK